MRPLDKTNSFIKLTPKKRRKDGATWALTYGDMVTALLCFFIIFYAIEKQFEKRQANPVKGYALTEGILQEHKSSQLDTDYEYAIEALEKIPEIEIMKTSSFVDISFKKIVFFERGKIELTASGKAVLDNVVSRLAKIEGKYILEIQGHSDSTRVMNKKSRWWNSNMELSVLRALKVHAYLAENYIEKNNLIVSGHGNQRKLASTPEDSEDINRRISLKLQLVK